MLARRLISGAGAGSGPLSVVTAREFTVAAAPNGAWPGGLGGQPFYYGGKTYFGFADNAGGSYAGSFDHSSGAVVTALLHTFGTADQHNRPALLRRSSDGRFLAVYCDHSGSAIYVRISTNPNDISSWGAETNIDSSLNGTAYTYPALVETSVGIFIFYRDVSGAASYWKFARSADDGATWIDSGVITSGTRVYGRIFRTSNTRLDMVFTDGSYCEDKASVYHVYQLSDGTYHGSDGTALGGSPPYAVSAFTKLYDGATNGARYVACHALSGSDIAVIFPVQTGTCASHIGADEDYVYARWNGSAWASHTVAASVGATTVEFTEGALTLDPANLGRVFLSKRVSGTWRIHEATTADAGATWDVVQRSTTGDDDMYPEFVLDHVPGLEALWLKGTFTSQSVYDTGIEGWGVP